MAVERLTDYTRRIWTALGPDAPAGHDIHVNDVIYYMDSSECCIVTNVHPDGSIDCETLPDIGGGGGGGGGDEAHPYIQTFDYVQATNWSSDSLGNTKNFIDTYCNHGNGIYWIGIDKHGQNTSDNYRAVRGFVIRPNTGTISASNSVAMLRAETLWSVKYSTDSSFHIRAGVAIRIWYIPIDTALEGMTT